MFGLITFLGSMNHTPSINQFISNVGTGATYSYKNDSSGQKFIALYSEDQYAKTNLEAFYSNGSPWVIQYSKDVTVAKCLSESPQDCPLHEQSAFVSQVTTPERTVSFDLLFSLDSPVNLYS